MILVHTVQVDEMGITIAIVPMWINPAFIINAMSTTNVHIGEIPMGKHPDAKCMLTVKECGQILTTETMDDVAKACNK